ncbi:hypothetical protein O5O45_12040 [Hahella aquimaris]|uniref:hypothetical protein n=1 Tax=Hahella sp. HNIBRBA332 TaxID=3015983 RepID=UPI00273B8EA0|nr:hypothetical protein [Hahella sp. HNIBRBA332]WLQ16650.1 hypothetical protein O5O45_12040 [Hahella sp. HNIBRBA332]
MNTWVKTLPIIAVLLQTGCAMQSERMDIERVNQTLFAMTQTPVQETTASYLTLNINAIDAPLQSPGWLELEARAMAFVSHCAACMDKGLLLQVAATDAVQPFQALNESLRWGGKLRALLAMRGLPVDIRFDPSLPASSARLSAKG